MPKKKKKEEKKQISPKAISKALNTILAAGAVKEDIEKKHIIQEDRKKVLIEKAKEAAVRLEEKVKREEPITQRKVSLKVSETDLPPVPTQEAKPSIRELPQSPAQILYDERGTQDVEEQTERQVRYVNKLAAPTQTIRESPTASDETPYSTRILYTHEQAARLVPMPQRTYSREEMSQIMANQLRSNAPPQRLRESRPFSNTPTQEQLGDHEEYVDKFEHVEKKPARRHPWEFEA